LRRRSGRGPGYRDSLSVARRVGAIRFAACRRVATARGAAGVAGTTATAARLRPDARAVRLLPPGARPAR
jgi:hypothetical protein